MRGYYILDGHTPVPCADSDTWARWLDASWPARRVAWTRLADGIEVSTVFGLGLDLSHAQDGSALFETLVEGGALGGRRRRYATWEDAERGHAEMVAEVRAALEEDVQESGDG